jgi:hypothetical protein
VLGAYNVVTGELTSVMNDSYITATQVCELLRKLSERYADLPILIVVDNTRYQRYKGVERLAKELGV